MAKVAKLTKALHASGAMDRLLLDNKLNRSNRQPYHPSHSEVRVGENNPTSLEEEINSEKVQRRGGASMTSAYKFERIDSKDEDWENKLERIMEEKIRS